MAVMMATVLAGHWVVETAAEKVASLVGEKVVTTAKHLVVLSAFGTVPKKVP
jgi:hypothetical protein